MKNHFVESIGITPSVKGILKNYSRKLACLKTSILIKLFLVYIKQVKNDDY